MKGLILLFLLITSSVYSQYMSDDDANKTMTYAAKQYSQSLPIKIDDTSTLIRIFAGLDRDLVYVYMVNLLPEALKDGKMRRNFIETASNLVKKTETNNFCSQPGLKIYRDQNITLEHNYVDQNNNYLFDVRVSVRNCNE